MILLVSTYILINIHVDFALNMSYWRSAGGSEKGRKHLL